MTRNQTWAVIATAAIWVVGNTAVAINDAGLTGAAINQFFLDLGVNELLTGLGLSVSSIVGFFAGKMRQTKLIKQMGESNVG